MAKKKDFHVGRTTNATLNAAGGQRLQQLKAQTQYNFKFIEKDKIISNPKNEMYTQDGIAALKESILVNGLRHNLSVLYNADTDTYRLISGERRYHAICAMTETEYNNMFPSGIPCKVEPADISEIDEEIMLISANHDVRESSMEVKRWEVSRLKELYETKKISGEIKNINAEIAKQLNISERQARKYTTAEKLIPELSELLNANGIDLNEADKFGRLDEDAQKSILHIIQLNGSVNNEEYQTIKKMSEDNAKAAKSYKSELDKTSQKLEQQQQLVESLQQQISDLQNLPHEKTKEDLQSEITFISNAKQKAEAEVSKLLNKIDKMQEEQKLKSQKNIAVSDADLKRISAQAKTEQALMQIENNFTILKNNQTTILQNVDLKTRVAILKERIEALANTLEL